MTSGLRIYSRQKYRGDQVQHDGQPRAEEVRPVVGSHDAGQDPNVVQDETG